MILENNGRKIIIGKNIPEEVEIIKEETPQQILHEICVAIDEGGYNPVSQLMGYIISEDPTHISNYRNARTLINKIDRDELLEDMIKIYIKHLNSQFGEGKEQDD